MKIIRSLIVYLVCIALLMVTPVAYADLVFDPEEHGGSFTQSIIKDERVTVGDIPVGVTGLKVSLDSDQDVDLELYDLDADNHAIIAWNIGEIDSQLATTFTYNGMEISYSGWDGVDGAKGHEYINISSTTTSNLRIVAFGYEAGTANVVYSYTEYVPVDTGYTLSYSAGPNGSILGEITQTVNHEGTGTTVTAVPDPGYHFIGWSDGLDTASRTDSNVLGDISVTANFDINSYTLTYTAGENGSIVGETVQHVDHGMSGTAVSAVPATGYHFVRWDDGVITATRTDESVEEPIAVTAIFAPNIAITVTADAVSKVYGDADPALSYQITAGALEPGDSFSGSLSRVIGESVGDYGVQLGTLTAGEKYDISFVSDNLTINARPLTVTADAKSKVYGDGDPSFTYHLTSGALVSGDVLSGYLIRSPGENVGQYQIQQGTLAAGDNYSLSFVSAHLTIATRPITITADVKSKVYGDDDPGFSYVVTSGHLASGDTISGTLARTAGEDVGPYEITQGTLSAGDNYELSFIPAVMSVTPRPITASGITANDKVYDGNDSATLNLSGAWLTGTVDTDDVSLVTSDAVGSFVNKGAGDGRTVTVSGLALDGAEAGNYSLLSYTLTANIYPRPVTAVGIAANSKTYDGTATTTSDISGAGLGPELLSEDDVLLDATGVACTFADKNVGADKVVTVVGLGLTGTDAANYVLQEYATTADINKVNLTATVGDYSKVYGAANPGFAVTVTGFVAGESAATAAGYVAPIASSTASSLTGVGTADISIQGGTADNYLFDTSDTGLLTITPKTLVATVGDYQKVYGDGNPIFTVDVTGFVNGESMQDVPNYVTPAAETTATTATAVGIVPITISGGSAANYIFDTSDTGSLVIEPKTLVATVGDYHRVYGDGNPAFFVTVEGFANGESAESAAGYLAPAAASAATQLTDVGTAVITISGGAATNYTFDTNDTGLLTISRKPISATATAQDKVYDGTVRSTGTLILVGVLAEDTDQVSASGNFEFVDADAGGDRTVNATELALQGVKAGNYLLGNTTATALASISRAPLIITADNQTKTYGQSDPLLSVSYDGFQDGDTEAAVSGLTVFRSAGENVSAGGYTITPFGASADNYDISYVNGRLMVDKARLTVTADDKQKTYGGEDPELTYTATGTLYFGDTYAVISGVSLTTVTESAATAGTHVILVEGGTAANYEITSVNGKLDVEKASLTVTADDQTKTYGDPEPVLSYTVSGSLYYGDGYSVISGVTLSTVTASLATAGEHAIVISGGTATNYSIRHVNGTLIVDKASLTVSADDKSKVYGASDPELTYTMSGTLYYGDTHAAISGVTLSTATGEDATVGEHEIVVTSGSAANYEVSYLSGVLTVSKAQLRVTADDKSKTYGDVDPVLSASYAGLQYDDDQSVVVGLQLSRVPGEDVRAEGYVIMASGATSHNYDISYGSGKLTINPAPLMIVANDQSKTYGSADPELTVSYIGLKPGDDHDVIRDLSVVREAGEAVRDGGYAITPANAAADNYEISYLPGTLSVNKAPLTVTANNELMVYGDADSELTYTPSGTLYYGDTYAVISGVTLSTVTGSEATAGEHEIIAADGRANNYAITFVSGRLTVEPKPISAVDIVAYNKYYDGTTTALLRTQGAALQGVLAGDDVSLDLGGAIGAFADPKIGYGKAVSVTGLVLTGVDAYNYVIDPYVTTASIWEEPPTPAHPPGSSVEIIVDGEVQPDVATATVSAEGEQTVTTITLDQEKLRNSLQQAGEHSVVSLPSVGSTDVVVGELNGQMVKDMEQQSVVLEVRTERSTYNLPATEINIDAVAAQFGETVTLSDVAVRLKIAELSSDRVQVVQENADQDNYVLVIPPLEFSITCTYGGQTVEVTQFNHYVERTVAVPDGVDPSKITTGVVVNADGSIRHVPTQVIVIDGKYYAKINSLTNSIYSVIWNPVEFPDMANHWAKGPVNDMASRLVMAGESEQAFGPNISITRGEFAATIVKALGLQPWVGDNPFIDVSDEVEYAGYIITAHAYGVMNGYADDTFRPGNNITREEAMSMVTAAMRISRLESGLRPGETEAVLAEYVDGHAVGAWSSNVVAACLKSGILGGRPGMLIAPKDQISRAETAAVMQRLLRRSGLI